MRLKILAQVRSVVTGQALRMLFQPSVHQSVRQAEQHKSFPVQSALPLRESLKCIPLLYEESSVRMADILDLFPLISFI